MKKMNKKGFTLVELMVVLAILGLLAGIGIPQYMNTLSRARFAADVAAVQTVQSAVNALKAETGATNLSTVLVSSGLPTSEPTFTSILQSSVNDLTLSDFLQGGALPELKSVSSYNWVVSAEGVVSVTTGETPTQYIPVP